MEQHETRPNGVRRPWSGLGGRCGLARRPGRPDPARRPDPGRALARPHPRAGRPRSPLRLRRAVLAGRARPVDHLAGAPVRRRPRPLPPGLHASTSPTPPGPSASAPRAAATPRSSAASTAPASSGWPATSPPTCWPCAAASRRSPATSRPASPSPSERSTAPSTPRCRSRPTRPRSAPGPTASRSSLVELGEDAEATERQLHRWRFHPALAHEATRWAVERHRQAHDDRSPTADRRGVRRQRAGVVKLSSRSISRRTPKPVPPFGMIPSALSLHAGPAMSRWAHGMPSVDELLEEQPGGRAPRRTARPPCSSGRRRRSRARGR